MSNRRLRKRNKFEMIKNYKMPLICVIITCFILITSTIIITNLINEKNYYKEKVLKVEGNSNIIIGDNIELSNENKISINQTMTFIFSNLTSGRKLDEEQAKYEIVCKYYADNSEFDLIPDKYIDLINEEVYREIGYIYFEDLKDEYLCISKTEYETTYSKLFNVQKQDIDFMNRYYIEIIDSYVVPKDNSSNENLLYKVTDVVQDKIDNNKIRIVLSEINLYRLYNEKTYDEIKEYSNNVQVDELYLTGQILNINMIKQNGFFVFDSYSNI